MEPIDKQQIISLLKTAKGQIDGIIRMVEEDRYCVDISKQMLSAIAILKKSNHKTLDQHIRHCVTDAIVEGQGSEKITEIMDLIEKYAK